MPNTYIRNYITVDWPVGLVSKAANLFHRVSSLWKGIWRIHRDIRVLRAILLRRLREGGEVSRIKDVMIWVSGRLKGMWRGLNDVGGTGGGKVALKSLKLPAMGFASSSHISHVPPPSSYLFPLVQTLNFLLLLLTPLGGKNKKAEKNNSLEKLQQHPTPPPPQWRDNTEPQTRERLRK